MFGSDCVDVVVGGADVGYSVASDDAYVYAGIGVGTVLGDCAAVCGVVVPSAKFV